MDLKYNSPKLESFYSVERRAVSPMWTEKEKSEDDNDAANTSDGEDQCSVQGNEMENNIDDLAVCDEGTNDGVLCDSLDWNDGVGTLVGSDFKFRMDSHGNIVLMDDVDLPCKETAEDNNGKEEEEEDLSAGAQATPDVVEDLTKKCSLPDAQLELSPTASFLDGQEMSETVVESSSPDINENELQITNNPFTQEKTEELGVSDPVLKEDPSESLYEVEHSKDDEPLKVPNSEDYNSTSISGELEKCSVPTCEICGLPANLGNRFCSRQCLGRHAAFKRRTNHLAVSKRGKVGKRKSGGRGRSDDRYLPQPDDILTVVHDHESGGKNDLKIKIRWSPSVNENRDAESATKEYAKQRFMSETRVTRGQFSWSSYLEQEGVVAVPVNTFEYMTGKDAFPESNPFQVGMSLEGVDPENEALICPLFVSEVQGYRVRLSFYGHSETYDFWRNADCPLIFPCGFCKDTNRTLQHPKGNHAQSFDWSEVSFEKNFFPAPKDHFFHSKNKEPTHKFKIGQKLEAVDKHNPNLVCVASINDIIGDQLLIGFDGWSKQFDFWCSASSQLIHRVEWCKDHNVPLTVPRGWNELARFQWGKFLETTMSQAVDFGAFSDKQDHGFIEGMKLEAVDPRNKILIRVATIAEIKGFQVKIHFDGWSDMYDFWTFLEDVDIHPIGWCNRTGHPLEAPISMHDKSYHAKQASGCPILGCSGIGHIKGAKFHNHYSEFGCPYSPQNLTKEHIKNRLSVVKYKRVVLNAANELCDVEQVPRNNPKVGRPPKRKRNTTVEKPGHIEAKRTRHRYRDSCENTEPNDATGSVLRNIDIVSRWTVEEVGKFVEEVTNESKYGKLFQREEMDGRALLMLTQSEILSILRIKLGPAVKIHNAILNIKSDS